MSLLEILIVSLLAVLGGIAAIVMVDLLFDVMDRHK